MLFFFQNRFMNDYGRSARYLISEINFIPIFIYLLKVEMQ